MKKPSWRKIYTMLLTAGAMLFSVEGFAQLQLFSVPASDSRKDRSDDPTIINSDAMDIDMANDKITLLGNVDVQDPEMNIKCRKMIIYLGRNDKKGKSAGDTIRDEQAGKEVTRIDCFGDVVIIRIMPVSADGIRENQRALAGKAVYSVKEEKITLTENPVLIRDANRLYGETIIMHTKTERVLVFKGTARAKGKISQNK